MYLLNPGKRKKHSRRKKSFASKNPMKTRRRRRSFARRNPIRRRRRRSFSRRNPARRSSLRHVMIFPNRGRRRHRRRHFASRNPMRGYRRRSFSRRNPDGMIGSIFDRDTMATAGGVVLGTVGTNLLMNSLLLPNATTGAVPFSLPGVDMTQANYMNSIPVAAYKFAIGAGAGYLLRNTAPRLAQGIVIGAFAGAISSILQQTNVLSSLPGGASMQSALVAPGTGRYFRPARGTGSYSPGVNPIFTGPASGFLTTGSPMRMGARRGAGALFNAHTANRATAQIPNPFGN
jgi:hypothetical protein